MSEPRIDGQWMGRSEGDPSGMTVIDIDRVRGGWRGTAYLFPDNLDLPSSLLPLQFTKSELTNLSGRPVQFDSRSGSILNRAFLQQAFPSFSFP